VRDCVSEKAPASRSSVHQGNVTEERGLEKLTLKNVKTGGQSRKSKSKSGRSNDVWPQAGRHAGRSRWICLISRTLTSTELGGQGSNYFAGRGNLTALSQSKDQASKWGRSDDRSGSMRTYSISERRVSRFSHSEPSSSLSPACTKHPRQSPLWCTRTTLQQCGHSSCSWGIADIGLARLVKSIFYCLSFW
jgi:hypothetical protein